MKILNYFFVISAVVVLAGLAAYAQTTEKPKNPNYDAALAKKLGANERGMKVYVLAILKAGPNYSTCKGNERAEIFKGHFANISRMAKEGTLVVAGPFGDTASDWAGLYIFNVASIEEAQKLTVTDPSIKAGLFIGEYHIWFGSAAMMEITRIHGTLTENMQ